VTVEPRRLGGRSWLLAAVASLVIARGAAAQPADLYVSIVDQYAAGDENGALHRSTANVPRIPSEITSHVRALSERQLRSATMLHTELAAVFLINGRSGQALSQITYAQRLLAILTDDIRLRAAAKPFAVHWYAFVTNLYASQGLYDLALRIAREGRAVYPNAAELLVARGAVFETRASVADARLFSAYGNRMSLALRKNFDAAAAEYAQALSIDPQHAFAHLHRGWVRHRVGDSGAVEDLEDALRSATDDGVRYLAHLFLGAEAERRDKLEEAQSQYEAAHRIGSAQSSAVALSRIESALGRTERARSITAEYAQAAKHPEDPWWNYLLGGFEPGAISWLRTEARRP
jgi:tetratricopeptide (TPR) repeat protein